MSLADATLTDSERIGRGLAAVGHALHPWVDEAMQAAVADGRPWLALYEAAESARRGHPYRVDPQDPRALLRIVRHTRAVFSLEQAQRAWLDELIATGNRWAHVPDLSASEADRALDTMGLLLESLGMPDAAEEVDALRRAVAMPLRVDEEAATGGPGGAADADLLEASRPDDGSSAPEAGGVEPPPLPDGVDPARAGFDLLQVRVGELDVVAIYREALNYALVSNRVSPVLAVRLVNGGDVTVDPGRLVLTIEPWSDSHIAEPLVVEPGPVAPGEAVDVPTHLLSWQLSPSAFVGLDESMSTRLRLVAEGATGPHSTAAGLIRLLPPDEWWALSIPEALAAHIRPNDASVATLLGEASELLADRTGSGAVNGYQGGEERAVLIAHAVYDAMAARGIRYIEPPASFEGSGQRIRSHTEVLEGRWGTCLDLACTYAAALESAGLHPVLVTAKGHAFTGYLVNDNQLPLVAVTDPGTIGLLVDTAIVEFVELTGTTSGLSFEDAGQATAGWWTRKLDEVQQLLDVKAAHRRVRPLPMVRRDGDTVVVEVEVERAETRRRVSGELRPIMPVDERPARVEAWRRSLLDLTLRNPLLNLSPARSGAALHVPHGSLSTLEDLVAGGQTISLIPHDQISELHVQQGARSAQDIDADVLRRILVEESCAYVALPSSTYNARMLGLSRKARTAIEETGANNLYLALGTLTWTERTRTVRAPLFLMPVQLTGGRGALWRIRLDETGAVVPNHCLIEKLRVSRGLVIPELLDPGADDAGIDLPRALQAVRGAILAEGHGGFAVEESAALAMLQFSTLEMWKDLSENWRSFVQRPAVQHLVETPGIPFADEAPEPEPDPVAEATTYLPVSADGSQLEAVRWARSGRSFVLEGPPGTGKSQTITNLIADCLAHGRSVLFVAEKQAALDVVRRRLDDVGLGVFSLDLHGRNQTINAVRSQLLAAVEHESDSSAAWETLRDSYRSLTENLARYPSHMHDEGPAGLSAWDARQVALSLRARTDVSPDDVPTLPPSLVMGQVEPSAVYDAARDLAHALHDLGAPPAASPWRLAGHTDPAAIDGKVVASAVEEVLAANAGLRGSPLQPLLELATTPDELALVASWLESGEGLGLLPTSEARTVVVPQWHGQAANVRAAIGQHRHEHAGHLGPFTPAVLALDLDSALAAATAADGKLFGKKKRRRAVIDQLAGALRQGGAVDPGVPLAPLIQGLVAARNAGAHLAQYVGGLPSLTLPFGWQPLDDAMAAQTERAIRRWEVTAALTASLPTAGTATPGVDGASVDAATAAVVRRAAELPAGTAVAVARLARAWQVLLAALRAAPDDVTWWRGGRSLAAALEADGPRWQADARSGALVALQRWTRLRGGIARFDEWGAHDVGRLVREGRLDGDTCEDAVRWAFAEAVLAERLDATGLRAFDERARARLAGRFLETGTDVRERMRVELPARIVAARTFDPRSRAGRSAEFMAQLGRRRGGLTIRQLLAKFGSIITEVTPCLLMSPHSVARFLPPEGIDFDVVVFDEASQIRVAESVGAMGRGRAVIVVGDSKQMPPTSMFSSAASDEEETVIEDVTVPTDMESILGEAKEARLPSLSLTWHYRSRDESLIAFSNRAYYDNRLASFPTPPGRDDGRGVVWRRVEGEWEGGARGARVNRAEAAAVVEEIGGLLRDDAERSIGVVTFNTQQRDLILDLLEGSGDPLVEVALARDEEPLFVKNLENVQGDERDVIIFTLAFAKDARGKVPLNWGPLTRAGGERRLNVAVTRAKERVVVLTSFEPEELDLSGSSSQGLADLRDYLLLAKHGPQRAGLVRERGRDLHLEEVEGALRDAGLEVATHVGLSDFTVELAVRAAPDLPWVAVMLDGPAWARRSTVSDREGLPRTVLEGAMGWSRVVQVWLPTWLREPEVVVEAVAEAARTAGDVAEPRDLHEESDLLAASRDTEPVTGAPGAGVASGQPESVAAPDGAQQPAPLRSASPSVAGSAADSADVKTEESTGAVAQVLSQLNLFTPADERVRDSVTVLDRIETRRARERVLVEVTDVLATEGPVVLDRLVRIVARRFGLSAVRESRRASIAAVVPRERVRKAANGDLVVWPAHLDPETWVEVRFPAAGPRDVGEVPYEELRSAMVDIARRAHGIAQDDLVRQAAQMFGVTRVASKVRPRLEGVLAAALREGVLAYEGGVVVAPAPSVGQDEMRRHLWDS